MQLRTQIYLEPGQHAALLKEAQRLGLSLAGMIRKLVDDHVLGKGKPVSGEAERRRAALSLIGLGRSGASDISQSPDEHLAVAIYADKIRERRGRYKGPAKRAR